jgi:hypothetical protein
MSKWKIYLIRTTVIFDRHTTVRAQSEKEAVKIAKQRVLAKPPRKVTKNNLHITAIKQHA